MKLFSRLSAVGAVLVLSTAFASATTYNLGSYTSGTNFGNINTPVVYFAGGCTSGGCTGAQAGHRDHRGPDQALPGHGERRQGDNPPAGHQHDRRNKHWASPEFRQ